MDGTLNGKRIAILATNGVEAFELVEPRKAWDNAGAKTELISSASEKFRPCDISSRAILSTSIVAIDDANADDHDALLLPGGVAKPDELRTEPKAINFVRRFSSRENPSPICHGPWMLVEADVVAVIR